MNPRLHRRSLLCCTAVPGAASEAGAPVYAGRGGSSSCRICVRSGKPLMSTSVVSGNEVQVHDRPDDGPVGLPLSVPTEGFGSRRMLGQTRGPVLGQIGLGLDGSLVVITDRNNTLHSWPGQKNSTVDTLTTTPSLGGGTVSSHGFNNRLQPKLAAPQCRQRWPPRAGSLSRPMAATPFRPTRPAASAASRSNEVVL